MLFALGILGVGLIGVPVLAGSGRLRHGRGDGLEGGSGTPRRRTRAASTASSPSACWPACCIQYSPISPMKALFWSAVINGVVAVPLMVVIILLASRKSVMGDFAVNMNLRVLGWIATAVMGFAGVMMFVPS